MSLDTFGLKTVWSVMPEFASPPSIMARRQAEILAISNAPRLAQFSGARPVHTLNHTYRFNTAQEIREFTKFFESVAGRWQGFYIPSWHAELNPLASLDENGEFLSITPVGYATTYAFGNGLPSLGRKIWLLDRDGSVAYTSVLDVDGTSPEILQIDPARITRDWVLGEFMAGFLYHVRLVGDRVSLDFDGPNQATCKLSFVETISAPTSGNAKSGTEPSDEPDGDVPPSESPASETWQTATGEDWQTSTGEPLTVN